MSLTSDTTSDTIPATTGDAPATAALSETDSLAGRPKLERAALKELLSPVRGKLMAGALFQVVGSIATLTPYIGLGMLAGALMAAPIDTDAAWKAVWVTLIGAAVRSIGTYTALTLTHVADIELMGVLRQRMVGTIARAPLSWFTKRSSGAIRKALDNDLKEMHYVVAHAQIDQIGAACIPICGLAYTLWVDWRLGLLSIATIPIYSVLMSIMMRGHGDGASKMGAALEKVSEAITELVDGIAVIKAFGETGRAHARYREASSKFGQFFESWVGPMLTISSLSGLVLAAPVVLIINLVGGWRMIEAGWVTPTHVLTTTLIALVIPGALIALANAYSANVTAGQAAYRVKKILNTDPLPAPTEPRVPASSHVSFDNVTFSYEQGKPVVHNVSFDVAPGTVTALVGPSGSGKSTLATLVPRFGDPDSGTVRIGGVPTNQIDPNELYRHVGFVLQNVQLLEMSIADNIRVGLPDATDDDVRNAAKAAYIHDVIEALPQGYDTIIGIDGNLSGGERQRVSIARAILANPPILVLDEATSFADPESEARIQQALGNLLGGRTLITIAHRLEVVRNVDQIVVLEQGRVSQVGTHDELIAADGRYHAMWEAYGKPADATTSKDAP